MILLLFVIFILSFSCYGNNEEPYENNPIEIRPLYHKLEHEARPHDLWLENRPRPHTHGELGPEFDQRHKHYKNEGILTGDDFITDPPFEDTPQIKNATNVSELLARERTSGNDTSIESTELLSRVKALASLTTSEEVMFDKFDFFPDLPASSHEVRTKNFGFDEKDLELEEFKTKKKSDTAETDDPFSRISTRKPLGESRDHEGPLKEFEDEKQRISVTEEPELAPKPREGFIPVDVDDNAPLRSGTSGRGRGNEPFPGLSHRDRIEQAILEDFKKLPDGSSKSENERSRLDVEDERNCCPCCKKRRKHGKCDDSERGCINPFVQPFRPHIFGTPPAPCCQEAQPPTPCCLQMPLCCRPELPCCAPIEPIQCCPNISTCCETAIRGCKTCRGHKERSIRTKRNGCLQCGRKRRDVLDEESIHLRQKRTCTSCSNGRIKRASKKNCVKCSLFGQQLISRMKRSFSCSSCTTHRERVRRQAEIDEFHRTHANHLRTCTPCGLGVSHRLMKRASDFEDSSFDPFMQCDKSCCAYDKCLHTNSLKSNHPRNSRKSRP